MGSRRSLGSDMSHLECSVTIRKRRVILEGQETGDPRNLYCNILRDLPNVVLTLVDSDMQGEVGPEAEVPREKTMLAIW